MFFYYGVFDNNYLEDFCFFVFWLLQSVLLWCSVGNFDGDFWCDVIGFVVDLWSCRRIWEGSDRK